MLERRRLSQLAGLAVLLATVLLGACTFFGDDAKSEYEASNLDLLDGVAPFPGASLMDRRTLPYMRGDSSDSPVDGYSTGLVYEASAGATDLAVIEHYEHALQAEGWATRLDEIPTVAAGSGERTGRILTLLAARGISRFNLNAQGLIGTGSVHTFSVSLDHDSPVSLTPLPQPDPPPTPSPTASAAQRGS